MTASNLKAPRGLEDKEKPAEPKFGGSYQEG
jgi:hypothetical protein